MAKGGRTSGRLGRTALVVGLVVAAGAVGAPRTAAAPNPGFGKAQAQLLMLDPRSAELSFGVRFGPTVADHRNLVARAQAWSTDYGLIGSALTADGCTGRPAPITHDQLPQPMRADSREPAGHTVATVSEGPITQSVVATEQPTAVATSRLAESDLPGIIHLAGASDRTTSGVDADGNGVVTASVEVGQLDLAGGLVQLGGLRWTAVNGPGTHRVGTFTIGNASLAGVPIPTHDVSAVVESINGVLGAVGLELVAPKIHLEKDTLFVDALKVGVVPNATRDQVAGVVLSTLQPAREALFGALLDSACDSAGAITVVDILLGSVTGGGSFAVHLGGAQAQLDLESSLAAFNGSGTPPAKALPPAARTAVPPVLAVPLAPGGAPVAAQRVVPRTVAAAEVSDVSDGALAVGLGSVGLGLGLVEADRRKMRRGSSPTPPTDPEGS